MSSQVKIWLLYLIQLYFVALLAYETHTSNVCHLFRLFYILILTGFQEFPAVLDLRNLVYKSDVDHNRDTPKIDAVFQFQSFPKVGLRDT